MHVYPGLIDTGFFRLMPGAIARDSAIPFQVPNDFWQSQGPKKLI